MWKKCDSDDKKLMADIIMDRISVGRLICVMVLWCLLLTACAMLTACSVQDKALVLISEEATDNQVGEDSGTVEENEGEVQTEKPVGEIVVFVCGAVQNPGVVELPEGSRAADALEAVGGLLAEAQPDYVNLAVKLEDAQKLYFPTVDEAEFLIQQEKASASGLVNINIADVELLCTLPGIGEARAEAIIAYREQNGGFRNKEDIMNVSGIKQSAYDKLQEYITIE